MGPYLTDNKTDATMDRTYDPGIKCGTAASTTAPFNQHTILRYNYTEKECNVASYRLMLTKSNIAFMQQCLPKTLFNNDKMMEIRSITQVTLKEMFKNLL